MDWTGKTTAMVRNIPSCYTQKDLLAELDARGWDETYDFFYLPFDQQKKTNCGYCFMNFKDPSFTAALHQALDGAQLAKGRGRKRLQVVPAVTQGYGPNLEHFQHSAVLNHHRPEHAPLFLRDGGPVANVPNARGARGAARRRARTPPLESYGLLEGGGFGAGLPLPMGVTTLTLHPIPAVLSQPMLYVELVRASIGYLVDFLHITPDCEAVVNFESPAAASHAAQILNGMSMLGSPPLSVGVSKIQGCGANILHYATKGEHDPKRQPLAQSFQYPVPELPDTGLLGQELDGPRVAPHATPFVPSALTTVDMNVEGSLPQRSPKDLGRFSSLGISLSEVDADTSSQPLSAEPRRSPITTNSWPQAVTPPDRTPPRSAPGPDASVTAKTRAMKRAQDMERALHAGFPDMLSSPACALLPSVPGQSSCGSSSGSHGGMRSLTPPLGATPVDALSIASTPSAPPCSPRHGVRGGLTRVLA